MTSFSLPTKCSCIAHSLDYLASLKLLDIADKFKVNIVVHCTFSFMLYCHSEHTVMNQTNRNKQ